MEDNINKAASIDNIYLAYLRLKNMVQNEELLLEEEILFFEMNLEPVGSKKDIQIQNIKDKEDDQELKEILGESNFIFKIRNILLYEVDNYSFNKFDFITKVKSTDEGNITFRPLTRYRFFDLVIMQSIFNILFEKLKNFLPKENYGVQLSDNPKYLYKNWTTQYKKFINEQKIHTAPDTLYQYAYEYDIQEFYPSISQNHLLNDIVESINLNKDDVFYKWIEKIIYYYNANNISEETKVIFEKYCEEYEDKNNQGNKTGKEKNTVVRKIDRSDLGLPQGPLFSSFLAVFYIRNLYHKFEIEMNNRGIFDFVHFSYMDDGRIYLQDNRINNLEDNESIKYEITRILNDILKKINETSDKALPNRKVMMVKDEKVSMLSLDEKSVKNYLDFICSDASLINSSINPRFEIPSDLEETVKAKHESIKNTLEKLYKDVKKKENEDEIAKIKKEYKTYAKRRASFLTRKISSKNKFYYLVKTIFECKDEKSNNDKLKDDISNFNFYYILLNLMKNAEGDDNKIKYLVQTVSHYLEFYKEKVAIKELMMFYYLATIKATYQVKYSIHYKEMLDKIKKYFNGNLLIKKYYYSYIDDSWILEMINDTDDDEKGIKNDNDTEFEAIDYFIKVPIKLKKKIDLMINHNLSFKRSLIGDSEDINIYKYRDSDIIIRNPVNQEDILYDREDYEKLNSDVLSEYKKMKWLSLLLEFWRKEVDSKGYINPAYLVFDNIRVRNKECYEKTNFEHGDIEKSNSEQFNDEKSKMIINDNKNIVFDLYGIKDEMIDYKEYLKMFFMDFFKCKESIIVNTKGRTLKFWEYRILSFLHNKHFNRDEFFDLLEDVTNNYDYLNHEVDTNFEKIRAIVDDNLGNAKDKDIIICLHYYLHSVWKNGSKDLTFFTLHNQEHSIELIQNYMKLSPKMLNKFSLNQNEKFILFSACYLHDIGMLKGLSKNEMYNLKNLDILDFYEDVTKYFKEIKIIKMETMLRKIYSIHDRTEQLFENVVRSQHPTRAKKDIEIDDMLPLTDLEKKYISEVSENHGNDYEVVYGLVDKEEFRHKTIDIRKISIWLRLLDLTDISKTRVTQAVFSRYFARMGLTSRFHWLKHLCVNSIEFKSTYDKQKDTKEKQILVTIKINMNYLPPDEYLSEHEDDENDENSSNINCFQYDRVDDKDGEIYSRVKESNEKCVNCKLWCAFLNENYWFEKEVELLNWYSNKYYNNEIKFKLEYLLDKETKRDKFEIYEFNDKGRVKVSADSCIKEYLIKKYSKKNDSN